MSKKLYVGNLSFKTSADDLTKAFSKYGTVTRAQVVTYGKRGRSRGFGIVVMSEGADLALADLNHSKLQGRFLIINLAKPGKERPWADSYALLRRASGNRNSIPTAPPRSVQKAVMSAGAKTGRGKNAFSSRPFPEAPGK